VWIGWNANQRRTRLALVANNARFCLLGDRGEHPHLASRALALNVARLSQDWLAVYGHPVLLAESFVDSRLFRGTSGPSNSTCGNRSNTRRASCGRANRQQCLPLMSAKSSWQSGRFPA